ncbi:MAG: hypothetical protein U0791_27735 [Gemmataceae bacterium]
MNERHWYSLRKPTPMIRHVEQVASQRKLRLLSAAACRRVPRLLTEPNVLMAIETAERFADGDLCDEELLAANRSVTPANYWEEGPAVPLTYPRAAPDPVLARCARYAPSHDEHEPQCDLIRDIFGNPFRPVSFDPSWRTSTAAAVAKTMYDSRDFAAMPLLVDALEDAGCTHSDILDHCRGTGPHVRGCWVVDLVLDKS